MRPLMVCHACYHAICSVDVNVSVRPRGSPTFGTRVEIKNMNSFSNMQKAIDFEIDRQVRTARYGTTVPG